MCWGIIVCTTCTHPEPRLTNPSCLCSKRKEEEISDSCQICKINEKLARTSPTSEPEILSPAPSKDKKTCIVNLNDVIETNTQIYSWLKERPWIVENKPPTALLKKIHEEEGKGVMRCEEGIKWKNKGERLYGFVECKGNRRIYRWLDRILKLD